jgi:ABC-type transport system involved in cytochrome c biogenesis ATPase subunit
MLSSFHVENFRTFKRLSLPFLGQVNLIVGRNNTGKTMLLEAVRLHSAQGSSAIIKDLLLDRDEFDRVPRISSQQPMRTVRLESLFYRRQPGNNGNSIIRIGPIDEPELSLIIKPVRLYRKGDGRGRENDWALYEPKQTQDAPEVVVPHVFGLAVSYGKSGEKLVPPEPIPELPFGLSSFMISEGDPRIDENAFVPSAGLTTSAITSWWDSISLTDAEERVAECMRIIAPIQRISLVERPGEGRRMAVVKLEGESDPVPLRSLGDGVRKIFNFALALEAARSSKILLIDEIENGIHYSALEDLWQFIIKMATQAGVQVFATTHSWDCVMGFQAAVATQPESTKALLIRLFRDKDNLEAVPLDRDDIAVAARDHIEIR